MQRPLAAEILRQEAFTQIGTLTCQIATCDSPQCDMCSRDRESIEKLVMISKQLTDITLETLVGDPSNEYLDSLTATDHRNDEAVQVLGEDLDPRLVRFEAQLMMY